MITCTADKDMQSMYLCISWMSAACILMEYKFARMWFEVHTIHQLLVVLYTILLMYVYALNK